MGTLHLACGEWAEAEEPMRRALGTAVAEGDARLAGQAAYGLCHAAFLGGRHAQAMTFLAHAREAFQRCSARIEEAHCGNALGEVLRAGGDLAEAERAYREASARLEALGSKDSILVTANVGVVLVQQGRLAEAEEVLRRCLEDVRRNSWAGPEGFLHVSLLSCVAARGDWEAWDRHLEEGRRSLSWTGYTSGDSALLARLGADGARKAGETARAAAAYAVALDQYERLGRQDEAAALRVLAAALAGG